jgi:hypothetical protein
VRDIDRLCEVVGKDRIVDRAKLAWRFLQLASPFDSPDEQKEMLRYATADGVPVAEPSSKEIERFVSLEMPFGKGTLEEYTPAHRFRSRGP